MEYTKSERIIINIDGFEYSGSYRVKHKMIEVN